MALIKCSNCGNEISSNAEKCIRCGVSIKKNTSSNNIDGRKDIINRTMIIANRLNTLSTIISWVFGIITIISIILTIVCLGNANYLGTLCYIALAILTAMVIFIAPLFVDYLTYVLKNMAQINETLNELVRK